MSRFYMTNIYNLLTPFFKELVPVQAGAVDWQYQAKKYRRAVPSGEFGE